MLLKFYLAVLNNNRYGNDNYVDAESLFQMCIASGKNVDLLGRIVALAIRKSN